MTTDRKRAQFDRYYLDFKQAFDSSPHTQESLAKAVGVTQGCVWQWLHRHRSISARRAVAVGQELRVDPRDISADYRAVVDQESHSYKEETAGPGAIGNPARALGVLVSAIMGLFALTLLASSRADWRDHTTPADSDSLTAWATFIDSTDGSRLLKEEIDALGITSIDQISVHGVKQIKRRVEHALAESEVTASSRRVAKALGLQTSSAEETSESTGDRTTDTAASLELIDTAEAQREHLHREIAAAIRAN